jgi:solute carrier family 35 protein E1
MLVCTFDVSGTNFLGLSCAFGSALIFVSSNIFFKKVMPSGSQTSSHRLDKLNLLFYSSGMAFVLMIPVWLYCDFPKLMAAYYAPKHFTYLGGDDEKLAAATHSVVYYFFLNGTVHFAQNIIAFIILASTSPVTYSIASLIKRVAVICIAILWFAQSVHPIQAFGIAMTFTGLYMYNQAKSDVEKGEHKMRRVEAARDMVLPVTKAPLTTWPLLYTPPPSTYPSHPQEIDPGPPPCSHTLRLASLTCSTTRKIRLTRLLSIHNPHTIIKHTTFTSRSTHPPFQSHLMRVTWWPRIPLPQNP